MWRRRESNPGPRMRARSIYRFIRGMLFRLLVHPRAGTRKLSLLGFNQIFQQTRKIGEPTVLHLYRVAGINGTNGQPLLGSQCYFHRFIGVNSSQVCIGSYKCEVV